MSFLNLINIFIGIIFFFNIIFAVVIVIFERRNPASTWAWLMILLFIPAIGFIVYLLFGQDGRKQTVFYNKSKIDLKLYELFLANYEKGKYLKILNTQKQKIKNHENVLQNSRIKNSEDLVYLNLMADNAWVTDDNNIKFYFDGKSKLDDLMEDILNAKQYIHIEYYIIRNDESGRKILSLLAKKATEGIEVKFLFDGMGCLRVPQKFFKPLCQAGGEISNFLPPFIPLINIRINYRNHRKICVIDGEIGYIGGLNIANEYLGLVKRYGYWRDTHIRITGQAVHQIQLRFIMDWNFASNSKSKIKIKEKYFPSLKPNGNAQIQIVSSGPDTKLANIKNGYFKMINEAQKSIYIVTPYFVPDDSIIASLKVAALSGIDVRIIFPKYPDHPFVYWASLSYIGELLQYGIKCFQYTKGFIHSKSITVDGHISSIGTANMDIRSFKLNCEINAFIYDTEASKKLEHQFIEDIDDCEEITLKWYKKRSNYVKLKEAFSRLLSPIL